MTYAKILVVEDECIVAMDIQNRLIHLGYDISAIALSGEAAIKMAADLCPDLVLMDINLNGKMDGIEAARQIQGVFNIPVVYLTAYSDEKTLERANVTEPFGYIIKPFEDRELQIAIKIALYKHATEKKLRESEEKYRQLVESANSVILRMAPSGVVTYINRFAQRFFGYDDEEILGQNVIGTIVPEFESTGRDLRKMIEDIGLNPDRYVNNLYENVRRNGERVWIAWTNQPIRDESGQIVEILCIGNDITERKQAEAVLKESERRLADIIDFLPDATFVIDKEGKVIAWNRAIEAMTGVKASDILGKGNYEYSMPFYGNRRPILIDLVLQREKEIAVENSHIERRDGTREEEAYLPNMNGGAAYLYGKAAVLYDYAGNVFGAIESIRDITDRKQAEQELAAARDELEERVAERTAELQEANKALEKAKENAEKASEVKSKFLATMSHEIRTPLNAIVGLTDLLLETDLDPEQSDFLETVKDSGDALLSIINSILDYSRIEKDAMQLECQPFELRRLVEDSMDLVSTMASRKNLSLTSHINKSVPQVILGDATKIRQVLVNLLSNAVKFTNEGNISVFVESRELGVDRHDLTFSVVDTGIGISEVDKSRLFNQFSQVDMSSTRRYGGTGLGLAISKGLVELMGGRIWVESKPGKGSKFSFAIQAYESPKTQKEKTKLCSSSSSIRDLNTGAKNLRILVAEDNPVNQRMTMLMLQKMGYKANAVANGKEVIEALERHPYDVILMDIEMPEMDGLEAARVVRRRWAPNGPKIIAVTAYALEGDRVRCLEAEMNDYLAKPVKLENLKDALERAKCQC